MGTPSNTSLSDNVTVIDTLFQMKTPNEAKNRVHATSFINSVPLVIKNLFSFHYVQQINSLFDKLIDVSRILLFSSMSL